MVHERVFFVVETTPPLLHTDPSRTGFGNEAHSDQQHHAIRFKDSALIDRIHLYVLCQNLETPDKRNDRQIGLALGTTTTLSQHQALINIERDRSYRSATKSRSL
jgi:hypothetical protein